MKKLYLIAALAMATMTAFAQQKLYLSTYNGTNIEKYSGKTCNVTTTRYIFNGWNTICLPFQLTTDEVNDIFGADCRLERLMGVGNEGSAIVLNFMDSKSEGLQANVPYVLYYTGENGSKKIEKEAIISNVQPSITFKTDRDETVTMTGAQAHTKGLGFYGIPAKDNGEVNFKLIDETLNGVYATRCYIQLSSTTATQLIARHFAAGEITSIQKVVKNGESVDVFNLSGQKVASGLNAGNMNQLKPGIYVVKGQKVMLK